MRRLLMEPFGCETRWPGAGAATLEVSGELELATVGELDACLDQVRLAAPEALLLDLRRVTFMGSSGINLLAQELPRLTVAGTQVELATNPRIDRVLLIARASNPSAAWSLEPIPPIPGEAT